MTRDQARKQCNRALCNRIMGEDRYPLVITPGIERVIDETLKAGMPRPGDEESHQECYRRMWDILDRGYAGQPGE